MQITNELINGLEAKMEEAMESIKTNAEGAVEAASGLFGLSKQEMGDTEAQDSDAEDDEADEDIEETEDDADDDIDAGENEESPAEI